MDNSTHNRDLIGELLVRAGMLMEDESGEMIRQLPTERGQLIGRVDRLAQVAADLGSLAAAAQALLRMRND